MPSFIDRTFAGGEIAPSLQVRGDQAKYHSGVNLCENFYIKRDGTAENRQGSGYIDTVKDSTKKSRVLEWVFNNNLSYILELGDQTMRFIKNGVQVEIATPAAFAGGTTYAKGDFVVDVGINYYSLQDVNLGNTPAASPLSWYVLTDDIMEIPTPWLETEIFDVKFDQQGDVVHLVHELHPPQKLTRTSDTGWIMTDYRTIPDIPRTGQLNLIASGVAGSIDHNYKMTIVDQDYQESLPIVANGHVFTITGVTAADPVVVTAVAHDFEDSDEVIIYDTGIPQLDGRSFLINNKTVNTFELVDEDGSSYQTSIVGFAGGIIDTVSTGTPTEADPTFVIALQAFFYQAPSNLRNGDVRFVNIYKDIGEGFGYIGSLDITLLDPAVAITYIFNDSGIAPDLSIRPPVLINYFQSVGDFPSTVQFIQQRLAFASSVNKPQVMWLSRIGFYDNFTTSEQISADDAINFILSGRTIEKIEHLVDATTLVTLTQGGEWILQGDENRTIRPTAINGQQVGYEGADKLQPIVIGNTVIYMQARSQLLRAIGFDENIRGFDPKDLSRWANHLFEDVTVVDWSYQKLPDSIFWMVMSDGTVVSMTFIIDEAIVAFARHSTDGLYESVAVAPEGINDIPYFTVKRTVNGSDFRYTERMPTRKITNVITQSFFLDSFVSYDGTNTGATTLTLTGGAPWGVDDGPYTLTASAAEFVAADATNGNSRVLQVGTDTLTCIITAFTSSTSVTVTVSKDVPVAFQGVAILTWGAGVKTFSGLGHLEAKIVAILADGNVENQETVASGSVTIADPSVVVRIGLPYNSNLETLDLEMGGQETLIDKKKRPNNMTIIVENSRGGWAGISSDKLHEIKSLLPQDWNSAQDMVISGRIESILQAGWQPKGKLYIQQRDPLPLRIIGLVPVMMIGG